MLNKKKRSNNDYEETLHLLLALSKWKMSKVAVYINPCFQEINMSFIVEWISSFYETRNP